MRAPDLNINQLMPEIILLALAIVILCADMLMKRANKNRLWDISFAGLLLVLVFTISSFTGSWTGVGDVFEGQAVVGGLTIFMRLIIIASLFITLIFAVDWLDGEPEKIGIFIFLTMISALGALVLSSAGDLLIMLLGLEILSIPLYILAGFQKENIEGREASFKYFILGSFASAFLILGIAMIYLATGSINLSQIKFIQPTNLILTTPFRIGIVLIITTFAFKGGLMPFYAWIPDVYRGSPDYVVGFMAAVAKASVFAALIRIGVAFSPLMGETLQNIFAVLFVLTVILGNLMALWQEDVKRMLAYSSIAHAGYLLLALIAFNQHAASAIVFYLVVYSFSAIGAFIVTGLVHKLKGGYSFKEFEGLHVGYPHLAIVMTIFMVTLSGIPPLAGFFGKLFIFNSAVTSGLWRYVVIASVASLIGVYYYFKVIVSMYMKSIDEDKPVGETESPGFYTNIALFLAAFLMIVLGLLPGQLYDAAFLFLKTLFL